ncbi:MAG: ABC transporter permease subunit [Clostridia bacterium]|nr:ABC transporter permease subunit [Clostridia bacterium]
MNADGKKKKAIYIAAPLGAALLIAVWWILSAVIGRELLLPSPVSTAVRLGGLLVSPDTWLCIGTSLLRTAAGIAAGIAAGVVLGAAACLGGFAEGMLSPLEKVVRATPVASFIILALVWIPSEGISVLISALIVAPIIYRSVVSSVRATDPRMLELAGAYGLSPFRRLSAVVIPSVAPHFIAACSTSVGLGWKAGIAAEVLCTPKNTIGRMLYNSKVYLETTDLFAWTVIVILLSVITELAVRLIRRASGV